MLGCPRGQMSKAQCLEKMPVIDVVGKDVLQYFSKIYFTEIKPCCCWWKTPTAA